MSDKINDNRKTKNLSWISTLIPFFLIIVLIFFVLYSCGFFHPPAPGKPPSKEYLGNLSLFNKAVDSLNLSICEQITLVDDWRRGCSAEVKTKIINSEEQEKCIQAISSDLFGRLNIRISTEDIELFNCSLGRGGYVNGAGKINEDDNFRYYFRQGWCSSSGAACGHELCFSTTNEETFSKVKNRVCNNLKKQYFENCTKGIFESQEGEWKKIAYIYNRGRMSSSISHNPEDCLKYLLQ